MTPSRRDYLQFADYLHDHDQQVPGPRLVMLDDEPMSARANPVKGWNVIAAGAWFSAAFWGIIWLAWHYAR